MSITIDPAGKFVFVANLLTADVSAFTISHQTGTLSAVAGSPFTVAPWPYSVTASGGFLYVSYNDVVGAISTYTIDPSSGVFTPIEGSDTTVTAGTGSTWGLAIAP
jgi:6-phosphogluconolactonase (cycloisomerase 2 family)